MIVFYFDKWFQSKIRFDLKKSNKIAFSMQLKKNSKYSNSEISLEMNPKI